MPDNKEAICFAIDDNHMAWYEMAVPFILSLRRTDYSGLVVVFDYGLSDLKRQILEKEEVLVQSAGTKFNLSYNRFISMSEFCEEHPEIKKAALYDADIWFCSKYHDLFEHVQSHNLYACLDVAFCTFISDPLIGENKQQYYQLITNDIFHKYGGALQAGTLAGVNSAWIEFGAHVRKCVDKIGTDFAQIYGIDTTFLHLLAADNNVYILPDVQNYIPRRGVTERFIDDWSTPDLLSFDRPIKAIHMYGDIRFLQSYRFYAKYPSYALAEGPKFSLVPQQQDEELDLENAISTTAGAILDSIGLRIVSIVVEKSQFNGIDIRLSYRGAHITACGNHKIVFETTKPIPSMNITMTSIAGLPAPIRRTFKSEQDTVHSNNELLNRYILAFSEGQRFELSSNSLAGQQCEAIWILG